MRGRYYHEADRSDLDTMKKASAVLDEFNIPYEMVIASAHHYARAVKGFCYTT